MKPNTLDENMTADTGSLSGTPLPLRDALLTAESGEIRVNTSQNVSLTRNIGRAPFSEAGMAERFTADPVFYRNLAAFVASELRRQADNVDGQGNSGQVIKGQLTELAEDFENTAAALTTEGILTPQAAQQAAEIITKLRDSFAALTESHPELFQLAVIGFAGYVLHQFGGVTADIGLVVSYAVIKKEKLADIFSSWKRKE
jgi:hypothetical protein